MDARFSRFLLAVMALMLVAFFGSPARLTAADTSTPALRTIVIFGDSLTAGYGLADPAVQSYPSLLQRKIDEKHLPYRIVNAGLSGDTTAGGLRRVDWILRQPVDIFILALGGNDGLRGLDPALTRANLQSILDRVHAKNPAAKLIVAGMQMPPAMGADYTKAFQETFPAVAIKSGATLVPFLLEGVGGDPRLNQADRIHPTAEGHVIVAENVWKILRPLL